MLKHVMVMHVMLMHAMQTYVMHVHAMHRHSVPRCTVCKPAVQNAITGHSALILQTGQLQGSSVGATLLRIHQHEGAIALFR